MKLVGFNYINQNDKNLCHKFLHDKTVKKYILGINKLSKSVLKHIDVDGIIDDFTRVQKSRKKEVLNISDVPKGSIILSTALGSPLEVQNKLNNLGFENFNYLSFYRYSKLNVASPPFILDFEGDFKNNEKKYENIYDKLNDELSKDIFTKILNFKQTFDLEFMQGFTNNFDEQYFDKNLIPNIKNINFIDGGSYVGDTLPSIIKKYPDFNTIYAIEPNELHMKIAKRDFSHIENIQFINCGLGKSKINQNTAYKVQNNCTHDYQTLNVNTIDNIISDKIDYIKLDVEGAEQDTIQGATNVIKKYHPILAICIYHKAEDWYMVPELVLNIRNDYDIYIRHYMEGIYETVMYFIPKNKY